MAADDTRRRGLPSARHGVPAGRAGGRRRDVRPRRGAPGPRRLDAVTAVAVAVDAGGSKIAGGLVTAVGELSAERLVATAGDGVEQTAALARELAASAGA